MSANLSKTAACLAVFAMACAPCGALDFQPFDWVPAQPGANILMGYYEYAQHGAYNDTSTGTVTRATSLDSSLGVARYLCYDAALGHTYVLDLIVPFGTLANGRIDGERLASASGLADPMASVGFWFVNEPERRRYLSAAVFVSLPIGSYDRGRALNLGANRWQTDLQVDFTQGFLDRFTIDVSATGLLTAATTKRVPGLSH